MSPGRRLCPLPSIAGQGQRAAFEDLGETPGGSGEISLVPGPHVPAQMGEADVQLVAVVAGRGVAEGAGLGPHGRGPEQAGQRVGGGDPRVPRRPETAPGGIEEERRKAAPGPRECPAVLRGTRRPLPGSAARRPPHQYQAVLTPGGLRDFSGPIGGLGRLGVPGRPGRPGRLGYRGRDLDSSGRRWWRGSGWLRPGRTPRRCSGWRRPRREGRRLGVPGRG